MFLYLATITELKKRQEDIFDLGFWDKTEYIQQERALEQLEDEIFLRSVWAD